MGAVLTDIYERLSNSCVNGVCWNLDGSYTCECAPGSLLRLLGTVYIGERPQSHEFQKPFLLTLYPTRVGGSLGLCGQCAGVDSADQTGDPSAGSTKGTCWLEVQDSCCKVNLHGATLWSECCATPGDACGGFCEHCKMGNTLGTALGWVSGGLPGVATGPAWVFIERTDVEQVARVWVERVTLSTLWLSHPQTLPVPMAFPT